MVVVSPIINATPPPRWHDDVYVTHNALDQAMAIARAGAAPDATQATSGIKLEPHLTTIMDAYVRDAQPGEDRATARRRIEAAIAQGGKATLSLKGLGLLEVPPVIPNVHHLDLSENRLSTLPPLPCNIQNLDLARNRLKELTNQLPTQLIWLDVSHNKLTHLPETLPARLTRLYAQDNGLRGLPKKLPRGLRELNVDQNRADLRQAAREHIGAVTRRRAFDVAMIGPGVSIAHARSKIDHHRCQASLNAAMACIPANRE